MDLRLLGRLAAGLGVLWLSACTTLGPNVPMKSDFWSQTDRSVSVVLAPLPEIRPHREGQQGLLDVAINTAMADELSTALRTISLTDSFGQARSEVVRRMQERGIKASFVETTIDPGALQDFQTEDKSRIYAGKDFRPLKANFGTDRLLLFTVVQAGTVRGYYGFIPLGSPRAIFKARGEMIDLSTNEVLWRDSTSHNAGIADPWDQAPEFSNVHAAVQKVIADARKAMLDRLFGGAPAAK
jgi:hypothetical protein